LRAVALWFSVHVLLLRVASPIYFDQMFQHGSCLGNVFFLQQRILL
jgi:hypothetical protein